MPKIIIHSPDGTFDAWQRQGIAGEMTELALACEDLPPSPFMKNAVWCYFNTYAADAVFMGGAPATQKVISVQVHSLQGGMDDASKKRLIEGATEILGRHAGQSPVQVHIVILQIPESSWGVSGEIADLAAMRASPPDQPAS